jgi:cytochrome c553
MVSIRLLAALVAGLCVLTVAVPTFAQSSRGRDMTSAELTTRLKEVEGDPKLNESFLKAGQRVAAICANCHGEGGNSLKPDIPNLAGQNPTYLINQMHQFASGKRRFEFMEGMIKAMSNDEKISVVLFYTAQKVMHKPAANAVLAAKGKDYFSKVCWRCHGENGRGNDMFPRIAGQQSEFMRTTLKRYRTGTGTRVDPLMAANTKMMTDGDIDAVVAYIGAME